MTLDMVFVLLGSLCLLIALERRYAKDNDNAFGAMVFAYLLVKLLALSTCARFFIVGMGNILLKKIVPMNGYNAKVLGDKRSNQLMKISPDETVLKG